MSSIEKFKKYMNGNVKVTLVAPDGTADEFEFKPLNVNQFATLMILGEKLDPAKNAAPDIETAKSMLELFVDIVKASYPDLPNSDVENFVINNINEFQDIVTKLAPSNMDKKKLETMKRIKEMQLA